MTNVEPSVALIVGTVLLVWARCMVAIGFLFAHSRLTLLWPIAGGLALALVALVMSGPRVAFPMALESFEDLAAGLFGEAMVGVLMGAVFVFCIFAFQVAGRLFGVGTLGRPMADGGISTLVTWFGALVFVAVGGVHGAVALLLHGFESLPAGAMVSGDAAGVDRGALFDSVVQFMGDTFLFGVLLALPVLVVGVGMDLIWGTLSRFATVPVNAVFRSWRALLLELLGLAGLVTAGSSYAGWLVGRLGMVGAGW